MILQWSNYSRWTVSVTLMLIWPSELDAVHLYTPSSSGFTWAMKNTSSAVITWKRFSLAARKFPPFLFHTIFGLGSPFAEQSNLAVVPTLTVTLFGVLMNSGYSVKTEQINEVIKILLISIIMKQVATTWVQTHCVLLFIHTIKYVQTTINFEL